MQAPRSTVNCSTFDLAAQARSPRLLACAYQHCQSAGNRDSGNVHVRHGAIEMPMVARFRALLVPHGSETLAQAEAQPPRSTSLVMPKIAKA
ncbi:hypothetical protein LIA77_08901 [Sarocladium implicatum]|nr:hypothetical protein LIA77_08901 [Sarocladium implicatum]